MVTVHITSGVSTFGKVIVFVDWPDSVIEDIAVTHRQSTLKLS